MPDPFEPITGIEGFNFCFFRNDGVDGYIDYYSLGSGSLIKTVKLPDQISDSYDANLLPHVAIENSYVTAKLLTHPEAYQRYIRNLDGSLTLDSFTDIQMTLPLNAITYIGNLVIDYNGQIIALPFYDGCWLEQDTYSLVPSNTGDGFVHFNSFGVNNAGYISQTGRLYKENPNTIQSSDPDIKRDIVDKDDLFVGSLTDYVIQVEAWTLATNEWLDWFLDNLGYDIRNNSHLLVPVFNQNYDDGNTQSKLGTGIIVGRYIKNQSVTNLFICVASELKDSTSGIRCFQRWFNSSGYWMYDFIYPNAETDPSIQYTSGRVDHWGSFYYVIAKVNGESYLRRYDLYNGTYNEYLLENPYKDIPYEGYYKLKNKEIVDGKYIVLNTSAGHFVFFDAMNPASGIQGEIVISITTQEEGFFIIPQIGDNQPASAVTNRLLQLCNSIRSLKMTWAANQVQVCQDHANWCVANEVFQHEGPGGNSVGDRNHYAGVYAGVSENIDIVMTSTENKEQTDAYEDWIASPHHLEGIIRGGNKYMSFASATYPYSVTEIAVAAGMWDGTSYTTEPTIRIVQEYERGKLKLYVQNFIWY
jgi:uncharacterized protein YkwD